MASQPEALGSALDAASARSPNEDDTLHSVTALARFEFEPGRGNDGTKIIMVEWQDDHQERHMVGSWQVSWTGKKTTFAADDNPSDSTNRLYFLLPPGEPIPPSITITYQPPKDQQILASKDKKPEPKLQTYETSPRPSSREGKTGSLQMTVNPLPAIFTPELGATAKASGKKGVLHTIWAKRRLQVLAREIRIESEFNLESIALEMAMAEKQWIEQNFGIGTSQPKPQNPSGLRLDLAAAQGAGTINAPISPSMQSPRSPGGRRLTDRLKGLSIVTNEKDPAAGVNTPTREVNPLSPEVGDMAVSSFATFKGDRPVSGKAPQTAVRRMVPISPPSTVTDDQAQSASASLAEIARGETSAKAGSAPATSHKHSEGDEEDLFAVAMSPRGPDEPKSPFSMTTEESGGGGAFSRIKGVKN